VSAEEPSPGRGAPPENQGSDGAHGERHPTIAPAIQPFPSAPPVPVDAAGALRRELARKALHVSSAVVPLLYAAGAPRAVVLGILLPLGLVAAAVEVARARSERARERFLRATGLLLREHEHHRLSGATWMLVAFTAAVAVYPRAVAVAAMWGVSVGDAAGAVVGRFVAHRRGRSLRAVRPGKTVAGSAACFALTLAGALAVARLPATEGVIAALAATLAERPSRPLDDNLRIVAAVGAGILLWRMAFS
jgi:dolichol kinase